MRHRPTTLAVGTWACVLVLGACASSATPSAPPLKASVSASPDRSAMPGSPDDIAFAQLMIAHHKQAIQLADLAATRAQLPGLVSLAAVIKTEQSQEVAQLAEWLSWWGAPTDLPGTSTTAHEFSESTPGEPPIDLDVAPLAELSGADFDRLWLRMMVTHHQGAVTIASEWLALTTLPAPRAFQAARLDDEEQEIVRMRALQESQVEQDG